MSPFIHSVNQRHLEQYLAELTKDIKNSLKDSFVSELLMLPVECRPGISILDKDFKSLSAYIEYPRLSLHGTATVPLLKDYVYVTALLSHMQANKQSFIDASKQYILNGYKTNKKVMYFFNKKCPHFLLCGHYTDYHTDVFAEFVNECHNALLDAIRTDPTNYTHYVAKAKTKFILG